jgi:pimeloyl-ACP methyl ester carboxylesterase
MAAGDVVVEALRALTAGGVARGGTRVGDGRVLRWVEAGAGHPGPAVVLAAGRNDTVISWAPLLAALAASVRVVAYDRAGLGASDPDPAGPPTVDRQVADLAAVVGQAGAGPCVLVGHSWGGLLAQLLAVGRPELVCGLVLVDPAHEDMLDGLPRPVRRLNWSIAEHLPSLLLTVGLLEPVVRRTARRTARRFSGDPRTRSAVARAYRTHARRSQVRASRAELRGIAASVPLLRQARAAAAASPPGVPLVVLSATRGLPPRLRRHWTTLQAGVAAAAGQGRHIVVADASHAIHHDRPDLVAAIVLDVVEQARRARGDPEAPPAGG